MTINVAVHGLTDVTADEAFRRLADYSRYPQHTSTVHSVEVFQRAGETFSEWCVDFRGGVLRWVERDEADPVSRVLAFAQVEGDLDRFDGEWRVEPEVAGCRISFTAEMDLGIPSLAAIVDPVARQALDGNIRMILAGLFADTRMDLERGGPADLRQVPAT